MKPLEIAVNDKILRGHCMKVNGVLWCHLNGRTLIYESQSQRSQKQSAQLGSGNEVVAPMPGKIIKVLVSDGQAVEAQQVLVVMEAMKMEYSLKSPSDKKVKNVSCKEGGIVQLGQTLVTFED